MGEVSRDTVGDWDSLTRGCQISLITTFEEDNRVERQFTTGVSKLASTNLHRSCTCSQTYADNTIRTAR